jgi:ATP-dependent RNA helicase DeaD
LNLTFKDLGLNPQLIEALDALGFESPTPIQEKSIPHLLKSENDLIALAQTGTGKTAAFSLPILNQIDVDDRSTQALILSPTRELCLQICRDIETFSSKMKKVTTAALYGGASIRDQIRALSSGVQVIVGTPGRTLDLIERKRLDISGIQYLVLDEADEMLSMGFQDSLDAILENTPKEKQTILFSATMPKEIRRIAKKYMNDPQEISVITENKSATNVSHEYYMTHEKHRYMVLKRIADFNPDMYSIVFCRTRRETQMVADKLMEDGYNAESIHGDLSQAQRDQVMQRFRDKKLHMLVATDVAARGIDVDDLTHVINYNLPDSLETYVHRSGRTGRANKLGICVTIINAREGGRIRQLENTIERKIIYQPVPQGGEICRKRLISLIGELDHVKVDEEQINEFLPEIEEKLSGLTREELIKRFVSVEFNRFLEYYRNAEDLNVSGSSGKSRDGRSDRKERDFGSSRDDRSFGDKKGNRSRSSASFSRYFINLGKDHNLNPGELINLINQSIPGEKLDIGNIDLQRNFSFFEIEEGHEDKVIKSFKTTKFKGNRVSVELANPKPGGSGGSHKPFKKAFKGGDAKKGGSYSGGGERKKKSSRRYD